MTRKAKEIKVHSIKTAGGNTSPSPILRLRDSNPGHRIASAQLQPPHGRTLILYHWCLKILQERHLRQSLERYQESVLWGQTSCVILELRTHVVASKFRLLQTIFFNYTWIGVKESKVISPGKWRIISLDPPHTMVSILERKKERNVQPNREERLNRADIEWQNSPALGKCTWLLRINQETQSKILLAWGLGSRFVICWTLSL